MKFLIPILADYSWPEVFLYVCLGFGLLYLIITIIRKLP